MMGKRGNNTVYVSIAISKEERDRLDANVRAVTPPGEEPNRNRFIRNWIASLPVVPR